MPTSPAPSPAAAAGVSISVRHLVKRYGAVEAARGVTFDVAPSEIFGLLGPNGAGKTTTLECILGLRQPDAGVITVEGIDIHTRPGEAKQRLGAQLQAATLQDKITPRQALALFAAFYREPAPVDGLIAQFDLADKADAAFDSLSGGQKQRLFLALALVNNPRVLVLDEPTAGLDPRARRDLHRLIAGLRTAGRTVVLSTHDLDEARQLCDRVGILDRGRLVAVARPAELVARAGALPRLRIVTVRPLEAPALQALPAVQGAEPAGDGWLLATADLTPTVAALVALLAADGNGLLDLQVQQPSLEDAFLELTGRRWEAPPPEEDHSD